MCATRACSAAGQVAGVQLCTTRTRTVYVRSIAGIAGLMHDKRHALVGGPMSVAHFYTAERFRGRKKEKPKAHSTRTQNQET